MKSAYSTSPKKRFNRQQHAVELLFKAFPGSVLVDEYGQPITHPLNNNVPVAKKQPARRGVKGEIKAKRGKGVKKYAPGVGQEGLL